MPQPHQPVIHGIGPKTIKCPPCPKCNQPMDWHSVETVQAYYGPKSVQVFKCESCDRFFDS